MISLCDDSGRGHAGEAMIRFKGSHFPQDIILTCVRVYVAYPLSYRQIEALMDKAHQSFLDVGAELTRLTLGIFARRATMAGRGGMLGFNTCEGKRLHMR